MLTGSIIVNICGSPFNYHLASRRLILPPNFVDDQTDPSSLSTFWDGDNTSDELYKAESIGATLYPAGFDVRGAGYESQSGGDLITLSGLLATDTVEVPDGSAIPVLANDTITLASGLKYWDLTIKRAGIVIALLHCSEGEGVISINSVLTGVLGGIHGSITTTSELLFHYKFQDGNGSESLIIDGMNISDGTGGIPTDIPIPVSYRVLSIDSIGNPIEYRGPAKLSLKMGNSPCLDVGLSDTFTPSKSITIVSTRGTAVISSDGTTVTTAGTLYDIVLDDGTKLPCAEVTGSTLFSKQSVAGSPDVTMEITTTDLGLMRSGRQDDFHSQVTDGWWDASPSDGVYYPCNKDLDKVFHLPGTFNEAIVEFLLPQTPSLIKQANLESTTFGFDGSGNQVSFTQDEIVTYCEGLYADLWCPVNKSWAKYSEILTSDQRLDYVDYCGNFDYLVDGEGYFLVDGNGNYLINVYWT